MKSLRFLLFIISIVSCQITSAQYDSTKCALIDSNSNNILESYNGDWQVGTPSKTLLNGNYIGPISIFTGSSNHYSPNTTSAATFQFIGLPYDISPLDSAIIYKPFEIYVTHRYEIDSSDYAEVHVSLDNGHSWENVQDQFNSPESSVIYSYHVFESTMDTIFGLNDITGSSNGWVRSRFVARVRSDYYPFPYVSDTLLVRFRLIADEINESEGWQLDSLCLSMDYSVGIEPIENSEQDLYLAYPNPFQESLHLVTESNGPAEMSLYNLRGETILTEQVNGTTEINVKHLISGIYFLRVQSNSGSQLVKVIKE